jgi:Ca2+/Na+ antiporter
MSYFLIAIGLFLLFVGGEALVRGAVILARTLSISPLSRTVLRSPGMRYGGWE